MAAITFQDNTIYLFRPVTARERRRLSITPANAQNVATLESGTYIAPGLGVVNPLQCLSDTWFDYTSSTGFTSAPLNPTYNTSPFPSPEGIIWIVLPTPTILNTIRFLLLDTDSRTYSYQVMVSHDPVGTTIENVVWHVVAITPLVNAASWQTISFEERPVTQIGLLGLMANGATTFDVVKVFAYRNAVADCDKSFR